MTNPVSGSVTQKTSASDNKGVENAFANQISMNSLEGCGKPPKPPSEKEIKANLKNSEYALKHPSQTVIEDAYKALRENKMRLPVNSSLRKAIEQTMNNLNEKYKEVSGGRPLVYPGKKVQG